MGESKDGEASGSKEETEGTEDEGMEEGDDSQDEEVEGGQDEEMDADKSASGTVTDGDKAGDKEEKKEGEEVEEKLCSSILALGRSASRTRTTARPWRTSSCV